MSEMVIMLKAKEVAICLKCGDRGYPEALVYCKKCQSYAQHRYCLETPRVCFVEEVNWFCGDCDPEIEKPSTFPKLSSSPHGLYQLENLEKEVANQTGKVQKKQIKGTDKKRQLPERSNISQSALNSVSEGSDADIPIVLGEIQCSSDCVKDLRLEEKHESVLTDGGISDEAESARLPNVCTSKAMDYVFARPIVHPVWRGNLIISEKSVSIVIGVVAHLSSLACNRVLEEAKLFPEVLRADMLQRSVVWPKSFEKWGPTDQSIALYFFPDSESTETAFNKLVDDVISLDMAMSAMLDNAELLIFPSNILPVPYWRFQSKFYLWGVFRKRKAPQIMNTLVHRKEPDQPLLYESSSLIRTFSNDRSISSSALQTYSASVF